MRARVSKISTEKPAFTDDDTVEVLPMGLVKNYFQWKIPHLCHQ